MEKSIIICASERILKLALNYSFEDCVLAKSPLDKDILDAYPHPDYNNTIRFFNLSCRSDACSPRMATGMDLKTKVRRAQFGPLPCIHRGAAQPEPLIMWCSTGCQVAVLEPQ